MTKVGSSADIAFKQSIADRKTREREKAKTIEKHLRASIKTLQKAAYTLQMSTDTNVTRGDRLQTLILDATALANEFFKLSRDEPTSATTASKVRVVESR